MKMPKGILKCQNIN